jgi:hypothetical protein
VAVKDDTKEGEWRPFDMRRWLIVAALGQASCGRICSVPRPQRMVALQASPSHQYASAMILDPSGRCYTHIPWPTTLHHPELLHTYLS